MTKTVIAAALGECVHVAGIMNFLNLAEQVGWKTIFLGPAVPIEKIIQTAILEKPDLIGVSYRLTPETGERLLGDFAEAADELRAKGVRFVFGGTPPVAVKAANLGFFEKIFDGSETGAQTLAFLKGVELEQTQKMVFPSTTMERILWKSPFPIIRHHFGLPTLEGTKVGIEEIANSSCLDVISLGIDQDAQEYFFKPEKQDPRRKGAGGVPVRSAEDYEYLYSASKIGNFPLMRTYSGTNDFIDLAEMYQRTIHNAWCAIPLFWFNRMDGRGPWDLEGSIREHQNVMRWHGQRNIPVELNEPHHWGMRDAPDVIFVVSAFLAAYNARSFGVQDYIAQFMFNSPPGHSDRMDLAKMLAILRLIEPLSSPDFRIWKQTRTGLLSYPLEPAAAKAHLASSVYLQMALHPHILHVVSYSEADHAATAQDVIESSRMAQRVLETSLRGAPEMAADPVIHQRVNSLVQEAEITLEAINRLPAQTQLDPWIDPVVLSMAVTSGILDAPHLRNNPYARGKIATRIINGACEVVDSKGNLVSESERLSSFLQSK